MQTVQCSRWEAETGCPQSLAQPYRSVAPDQRRSAREVLLQGMLKFLVHLCSLLWKLVTLALALAGLR